MSQVMVDHKGVTIYYNESEDHWYVDDDKYGITLSRKSLNDAKKGIDTALRKMDKGVHKRFLAWKYGKGWSDREWFLVEVTSLVEGHNWDGKRVVEQAWITYPKVGKQSRPDREKVQISQLSKDIPENRGLIEQIKKLDAQIRELHSRRSKVIEQLHDYSAKDFEEV